MTKEEYLQAQKQIDNYIKDLYEEFHKIDKLIDKDLESIEVENIITDEYIVTFWIRAKFNQYTGILNYLVENNGDESYWGQIDDEIKSILNKHGITENFKIERYVGQ